ncbi:MAG: metallophosphoesterase [Zavarzinella sp.]
MPDAEKLITMIYRAIEAVRSTAGRRGKLIELNSAHEVIVVGDLHGNLDNFKRILPELQLKDNPHRHLVLQEVIHGKHSYPTGGDKSHQLLDVFCAMKSQFPQQVHLIMGNHELSQWIDRPIVKGGTNNNDRFLAGIAEYYGATHVDRIEDAYKKLFKMLPLAIRTSNRVFISHSIPGKKYRDQFALHHLETDSPPNQDLLPGGSIYELLWGRDVSEENVKNFLGKVACDWLITGHIPCDNGYLLPNPHQVVIETSELPGAYIRFATNIPLNHELLVSGIKMLH